MSKPENPPLFHDGCEHIDEPFIMTDITLRDLFAAAALAGQCVDGDDRGGITDQGAAAKWCYRMADAMLAAREEGK